MQNRITELIGIRYPIIQAGMVWCAGWELASASSNAGALGIIGSGSMYPDVLRTHIRKCKEVTSKPFAVNVPLMYPQVEEHMKLIVEERVPVVFTSAGNPKRFTPMLKEQGVKVVHVVSSSQFARKAAAAGADAVVAEGFEAGGHNGREETTTMVLVPAVVDAVDIPVIAAGGIGTGRQMMAAIALGAEGVQMGTRFVASKESSAHPDYKAKVLALQEGDTMLSLKALTPVRLVKNNFFQKVYAAEKSGADKEFLQELLGKGRSKKGMFEGDLEEGELEIGQVSALVGEIKPTAEIVDEIWNEFKNTHKMLQNLHMF